MSISREQHGEAAQMNAGSALLDEKQEDGKEGIKSLQVNGKINSSKWLLTSDSWQEPGKWPFFLAFLLSQEEYVTAFYEAYAKMQMELVEASKKKAEEPQISIPSGEVTAGTSSRQVGVKSKREELEEDELEWEEASPIGRCRPNQPTHHKFFFITHKKKKRRRTSSSSSPWWRWTGHELGIRKKIIIFLLLLLLLVHWLMPPLILQVFRVSFLEQIIRVFELMSLRQTRMKS